MSIPASTDRMPTDARKPRAGPLLEPAEAIAVALSMVPDRRTQSGLLTEKSPLVKAVVDGLHLAGYKIVPR